MEVMDINEDVKRYGTGTLAVRVPFNRLTLYKEICRRKRVSLNIHTNQLIEEFLAHHLMEEGESQDV